VHTLAARLSQAVEAGGDVATCATAWDTATCANERPAACDLAGELATGEACFWDAECATNRCVITPGLATGKCAAQVGQSQRCRSTADGSTCSAGLRCGTDATCHGAIPIGMECSPYSRNDECVAGATCAPVTAPPMQDYACVARGREGEVCSNELGYVACVPDLVCRITSDGTSPNVGLCAPPTQLGDVCSARTASRQNLLTQNCADGLVCAGMATESQTTCIARAETGGACANDAYCQTGLYCADKVCQPFPARIPVGAACEPGPIGGRCTIGAACVSGFCVSVRANEGEACGTIGEVYVECPYPARCEGSVSDDLKSPRSCVVP